MMNRIFRYLKHQYALSTNERYKQYLINKGILIGENVLFRSPKTTHIDLTRPSLIEIGNNVDININFTIFTHDWTSFVFRNKYKDFIPSSGKVKVGNNVYFGCNVTILKNVSIGNNCVIGTGAVVTRDIPSDSVAFGVPAKVISTIDNYYEKRKACQVEEAFIYAKSIQERFNRMPVVEDFWEEFGLFVTGDDIDKYPTLPIKSQLGPCYDDWIKNHKTHFKDFNEFLRKAGIL